MFGLGECLFGVSCKLVWCVYGLVAIQCQGWCKLELLGKTWLHIQFPNGPEEDAYRSNPCRLKYHGQERTSIDVVFDTLVHVCLGERGARFVSAHNFFYSCTRAGPLAVQEL